MGEAGGGSGGGGGGGGGGGAALACLLERMVLMFASEWWLYAVPLGWKYDAMIQVEQRQMGQRCFLDCREPPRKLPGFSMRH